MMLGSKAGPIGLDYGKFYFLIGAFGRRHVCDKALVMD
jgi:hypothetical protein